MWWPFPTPDQPAVPGTLALCPALLVRAGPCPAGPLQRQPALPPQRARCHGDARQAGDRHGDDISFRPVEHHLAHASSAYHLSGFTEKTAILGIDGKGEYATTFFGYGENGRIHKLKEFYDPDSLGGLYGALTEYLGFEMLDGEFKVMGMAPYGDPKKHDLSRLIEYD